MYREKYYDAPTTCIWVVDSGANTHFFANASDFTNPSPTFSDHRVSGIDRIVEEVGNIIANVLYNNGHYGKVNLENVILYVPGLAPRLGGHYPRLMNVYIVTQGGSRFSFAKHSHIILAAHRIVITIARHNGLIWLPD